MKNKDLKTNIMGLLFVVIMCFDALHFFTTKIPPPNNFQVIVTIILWLEWHRDEK